MCSARRLRCIAFVQRCPNRIALTCLRGFNDAFGDGLAYRCRLGRVGPPHGVSIQTRVTPIALYLRHAHPKNGDVPKPLFLPIGSRGAYRQARSQISTFGSYVGCHRHPDYAYPRQWPGRLGHRTHRRSIEEERRMQVLVRDNNSLRQPRRAVVTAPLRIGRRLLFLRQPASAKIIAGGLKWSFLNRLTSAVRGKFSTWNAIVRWGIMRWES